MKKVKDKGNETADGGKDEDKGNDRCRRVARGEVCESRVSMKPFIERKYLAGSIEFRISIVAVLQSNLLACAIFVRPNTFTAPESLALPPTWYLAARVKRRRRHRTPTVVGVLLQTFRRRSSFFFLLGRWIRYHHSNPTNAPVEAKNNR